MNKFLITLFVCLLSGSYCYSSYNYALFPQCFESQESYTPYPNEMLEEWSKKELGLPHDKRMLLALTSKEKEIDEHLSSLEKILKLYQIDPYLLEPETGPEDSLKAEELAKMDLAEQLSILSFYDENKGTRNDFFDQKIKEPLIKIITGTAETGFYIFPTLKYLNHIQLENNIFSQVVGIAFKDIFTNHFDEFRHLQAALTLLKIEERLSPSEEKTMPILHRLADFFYARKAVRSLITSIEKIQTRESSFTPQAQRFSTLRILQLQGEFLKSFSSSISLLEPNIPYKLLGNIRDQALAHLSSTKLDRICSDTEKTSNLFSLVTDEIKELTNFLGNLDKVLDSRTVNQDPKELWQAIKNSKGSGKDDIPYKWPGLEGLYSHLTKFNEANKSIGKELTEDDLIDFYPYPHNEEDIKRYQAGRKELFEILALTGKSLEADFEKRITSRIPFITGFEIEAMKDTLQKFQQEIGEAFKEKKKDIAENKRVERNNFKQQTVLKLLNLDEEAFQEREQARKSLEDLIRRKREFYDFLQGIKPCQGHGNLSDKFKEFCEMLPKYGIPLIIPPFMWNEEPTSPIEVLFHKVHRTNLGTLAAKNDLRKKKIGELLNLIKFMRKELNIRSTVEEEVNREVLKDLIEGKRAVMSQIFRESSHQFQPFEKQGLENIIKRVTTAAQELNPSQEPVNISTYLNVLESEITNFLNILPFSSPAKETLKEELTNRNIYTKRLLIKHSIKDKQIWSDHRFHFSTALAQQLTQKGESLLSYEFMVAAFYELFKEINDYPELACLYDTDEIRNQLMHPNPFTPSLETTQGKYKEVWLSSDPIEQIAKEISILTVNVKYILESVQNRL